MYAYLLIVLMQGICEIKCASLKVAAEVEGNQTKQIQDLQKEKVVIYNQLNDAVEDTIKTLEKSNDSDAKQGIMFMQELLALVDKFNATELVLAQVCNNSKECNSRTTLSITANSSMLIEDGRRQDHPARKTKDKYKPGGYDHVKYGIMATGMFKNDDEINKVRDEKVRNLLVLQTKLDKWLKLREVEKQKIKQYRLRQVSQRLESVTEECPNFGETRKKKKKFGSKSKGDESRKLKKYPCCRKCCKKSYLGCL